jgi:RNA polymerase sigma factor (sigma-70 family)
MRTFLGVESSGGEPEAWAASLENDGNAFAVVFDMHRDRVYHHALRMTTNVHDAEDVTAGAFLELWRRRRAVRVVDGSVMPWLLVTTTNLSRNLTRSLRRYRTFIAALPRVEVAQSAEDLALKQMEEFEIAEKVRNALIGLSTSDAALIVLTAFEHYSPAQAAVVLGITDGAARTRLHRARTRMAAVLEVLENNDSFNVTKETSL